MCEQTRSWPAVPEHHSPGNAHVQTQKFCHLLHHAILIVAINAPTCRRKWNVKPQPYGESWVQGDVMGCGIDLDAGSITFWRNGQCLGVAYDRVRTMQPSLAYFPAVSLSHTGGCCT
jgi:hypothetical protein